MTAVLHIPHIVDISVLYAIAAVQQICVNGNAAVFKPERHAIFRQIMLNAAVIVLVYSAGFANLVDYAVCSRGNFRTVYREFKEPLEIYEQCRLHHSVKVQRPFAFGNIRVPESKLDCALRFLHILRKGFVNTENLNPRIFGGRFQSY